MQNVPKDFLWGASTASHQVEGNTHNQWSVWEKANAERLARTASARLSWLPNFKQIEPAATGPANYMSGSGVDHYNRFKEDFAILKQLNMNAFRFGIEWSRIEPTPGEWDQAAIEHYRVYITELKRLNIEPILTLWHWTMPTWFTDKGGFAKKANIQYFERYVTKIAELFGNDLKYVITLNEPNVYTAFSYLTGEWPPERTRPYTALRVYRNLVRVHNRAYDILKTANPTIQVGIAAQLADMRPVNKNNVVNKVVISAREYFWNWWFVDKIRAHQDFVGLNYYFTEYVNWHGKLQNPSRPISDVGWYMEPRGIGRILQKTSKRYQKPIIITENGLADSKDTQRKWWLEQTFLGMEDALGNGVQLAGYLHWSLMDNFEWAYGWWPQFGLVAVDRTTMHRTIRPSSKWLAETIAQYSSRSSS